MGLSTLDAEPGRVVTGLKDSSLPSAVLEVRGPVATVRLDRPAARNALGLDAWRSLKGFIAETEDDPTIRVIILRGSGGHFSAGNDISEFGALQDDPAAAEAFGAAMASAMRAVEEVSKPMIVAIEGACYGAAVALTLAGDIRMASDSASFAITPAKLGALYLQSDLHRLVAAIGVGQAKRLIYSAQAIDADEAKRIGLVERVCPAGTFEAELETLVAGLLHGSAFTLTRTKAMLRATVQGPTPHETPETLAAFVEATQGPDFREGVSAFLGKRLPTFV